MPVLMSEPLLPTTAATAISPAAPLTAILTMCITNANVFMVIFQ